MKRYTKMVALLGLSAATLNAAGYKIPQQSLNSMALGAAYVANTDGADSNYYNPANMVWMDEGSDIEVSLTYIHIPQTSYKHNGNSAFDAKSLKESSILPTIHYMSPSYGDYRFGFSMVVPAGLSRRWDATLQKATAEEFGLKIIELNPNVAYRVNDRFAVGFGLRGLYSTGVINLEGTGYKSEMEADSINFGYNLAMSYKPIENLTLSAAYRSKVDLSVEGDAKGNLGAHSFDTDAKTLIPLPAALALAVAYTVDKTTVEFVYDRTYWSAYDSLDFNFADSILEASALGQVKPKNWKDSNTYRFGVTHRYSDELKLMAGFGIDKSPIPDSTLGFETPDSDALIYSAGFEYKINRDIKMGLAYLVSDKKDRRVSRAMPNPNGEFTDSAAHMLTLSFKYKF
jgi:long-chain fatty acid transport protein